MWAETHGYKPRLTWILLLRPSLSAPILYLPRAWPSPESQLKLLGYIASDSLQTNTKKSRLQPLL